MNSQRLRVVQHCDRKGTHRCRETTHSYHDAFSQAQFHLWSWKMFGHSGRIEWQDTDGEWRRWQDLRVRIDPNVRVKHNWTFVTEEDFDRPLTALDWCSGIGAYVVAYEAETGVQWPARIADTDIPKRLVYLAVQWSEHIDPPESNDDH